MRLREKTAIPLIAAWLLVCTPGAQADPVPVAPSASTSPSRDDVSAAIRASDSGGRSVVDAFDPEPARETAAAAKTNADRRAALAALGMQPQPAQRQAGPSQSTQPGKEAVPPATDALKYDDLSKSGIADAVRSLKADLKAQLTGDKDTPAAGTTAADGTSTAAKTKDEAAAANSVGDSASWANAPTVEVMAAPKTAAQVERDRVLAAAGMEKLIATVQPWVIGLLVLMGLVLTWRMTLRYLRSLETRRRRRLFSSTQPRRSQF